MSETEIPPQDHEHDPKYSWSDLEEMEGSDPEAVDAIHQLMESSSDEEINDHVLEDTPPAKHAFEILQRHIDDCPTCPSIYERVLKAQEEEYKDSDQQ